MEKIGFIGTGVMGSSMIRHLLNAGYPVQVYNRTKSRADAVVAEGAVWCDTPADVTAQSDIVITMVGYPKDVEETYFGESGIFSKADDHHILIDMTTSTPTLAGENSCFRQRKRDSHSGCPGIRRRQGCAERNAHNDGRRR